MAVERSPCGTGEVYAQCCAPVHTGERAAHTAQELMRSRFSAFARGDAGYLRSSWHPSTRPARVDLDDGITWTRLEIVEVVGGGPWDRDGVVVFRAHHRSAAGRGVLVERSTFTREQGRWFYVTGTTGD